METALFCHIGGKNKKLGEEISALFPYEKPDIYIEPYGGSFGACIQSDYMTDGVLLIHNDMDMIIHSIFKAVTQFPEATLDAVHDLLDIYDYEKTTVDYFRFLCHYKAMTDTNLFNNDIYLGAAAWILKMITRNGDCKSLREISTGNEIEKMHRTFQNRENTAYNLEGVVALCMDAMEILEKIKNAGRTHEKKIFLYIDAPYSHSGKRKSPQNLYGVDIDKDDRQIVELAKLLEEINQDTDCKILVSEYDTPIYNAILTKEKGWKKIKVCDVYKSMTSNGECKPIETEYVWCNYDCIT